MTLPLTQLLQSKSNDIMDGLHFIDSLKSLAISCRNSVDFYHDSWYKEALVLAEKVNVLEAKPRTVSCQVHRGNTPSESTSDYFKKVITIPLLDHLNSELKNRFHATTVISYEGLAIIPSKMISLINKKGRLSWRKKFEAFIKFYIEDFPNPIAFNQELNLWERHWELCKHTTPKMFHQP